MFLVCAAWGWSFLNLVFFLHFTIVSLCVLLSACKAPSVSKLRMAYLHCTFQTFRVTCSFHAGVGTRLVSQVLERVCQSSKYAVTLHRFLGDNMKYYSCKGLKHINVIFLSRYVTPRRHTHMPVLQKRQDRLPGRVGSFPCLKFSTDALQEIQSSVTRFLILQLDPLIFGCDLCAC